MKTYKEQFNEIIDCIESRAMATDGPVSPTLTVATEKELSRLWYLLQKIQEGFYKPQWIKSSKRMPTENMAVFVFIPEEDNHITTGMWDVSKKWVLLDEYRVPRSEVTYWAPMFDEPEDQSYTPSDHRPDEMDTITYQMRDLQKQVFELAKENEILRGKRPKSLANFDVTP
jgi:hypothetical protein